MFYTNVIRYKNEILVNHYENSQRTYKRIKYKPTLFTETDAQGSFVNIDGTNLIARKFNSIYDAGSFLRDNSDIIKIYGNRNFSASYVADTYKGEIDWKYDDLNVYFIDIETDSSEGFIDGQTASKEILSISIYARKTDTIYQWGLKEFEVKQENYGNTEIVYRQHDDEKSLLDEFVIFWAMDFPDIISGWHSSLFDMPYLINRIKKTCGEEMVSRLSPWGVVKDSTKKVKQIGGGFKEVPVYDIYGIQDLDYMDLYKKFITSGVESMKLDHIAYLHLGEKKLDYEGSLHQLYVNDFQKFIEYNIQDTLLVYKLDKELGFMELLLEMAYQAKLPKFDIALATINMWEIICYNHLYEKGIMTEVKEQSEKKDIDKYEGGFVKEPMVGMHDWVISFDLTSLYPSLIRMVNIGPETYLNKKDYPKELKNHKNSYKSIYDNIEVTDILKKYNLSMSASGELFRKDRDSFLSELMEKFFNKRTFYKKSMFNEKDKHRRSVFNRKQHAFKILINSAYGAIGNTFFQYFSLANAESITLTGQFVIRSVIERINHKFNTILKTYNVDYVIAADTDSVYINFKPIVDLKFNNYDNKEKIVDYLCKVCDIKIDKILEDAFTEIIDTLNSYKNVLSMKREVIADKAFWRAKKNYFMRVWDSEGERYEEPKLKVMGIEVVKSSTPKMCRDALKNVLNVIIENDHNKLMDYIYEFKDKFLAAEYKDIGKPTSVNGMDKYDSKGNGFINHTPGHVKGALTFNSLLEKRKLTNLYDKIQNGSKIKTLALYEKNPFGLNSISFIDKIPKELNLDSLINRHGQFEKVFLKPVASITDTLGWDISGNNNLLDLI
jgi:DNA polymerase elongation subunit (family B)